jgi:hypothetical protein
MASSNVAVHPEPLFAGMTLAVTGTGRLRISWGRAPKERPPVIVASIHYLRFSAVSLVMAGPLPARHRCDLGVSRAMGQVIGDAC